jgi:hypothetical protein
VGLVLEVGGLDFALELLAYRVLVLLELFLEALQLLTLGLQEEGLPFVLLIESFEFVLALPYPPFGLEL